MALLPEFEDEFGDGEFGFPTVSGTAPVIPLGTTLRIGPDNTAQFYNADQDKWHTVRPTGIADEEEWEILAGEE